ncbi:ABC-F family ATP-binding cassette domain-containing protein [Stackebrandtia nassauensis]|uniref:ABC transporter related protein n=1 Tax=Stackebrandtia nassauensis (strain DSM 44728 / CIP 108903 / NRRL B-16338 / NBRC 102104 / LLR-40K-21) TaxID=446470 RepID=D3Q049_STANL|nr:ABC-F family ATP-binding cassette domain-containing protein [Stackebrandtia nassauensis]ADD45578.1 ABC transporter related protein [Stackebrandtia nassauensis DSM 44728]
MSTFITANSLTFGWPDGGRVFDSLDFVVSDGRTGLVGDNGTGKSTLLRLITGELEPTSGAISVAGSVEYLPQELPLRLDSGVDELLGIADKRKALRAIESGDISEATFAVVGEDWDVEERARARLDRLGLSHVELDRTVGTLSGGESMLVGLAGRLLREPKVLILDEPTNNLDIVARELLYRAVDEFTGTLLIVSHDRQLLERVDAIAELREGELRVFEGNFSSYEEAIAIEQAAAQRLARTARADMNKQKQELVETQVKLARRERYGRKMMLNKREPKIVMGARKRAAQVSAGKLRNAKQDDVADAKLRLDQAEEKVRDDAEIRVDLPETEVHPGRDVFIARDLNFAGLFGDGVNLHVQGPERIALTGANGSGKTTLLRLIAGELDPQSGGLNLAVPWHYLPQRLELLDESLSVFENVRRFAPDAPQTLLRNRLARFGLRSGRSGRHSAFRANGVTGSAVIAPATADQPVSTLSGGERLRAALAAVLSSQPAPQLLMLDEPTNNLDMTSARQLAQALNAYRGALIVVSHDPVFLSELGITRWLRVERGEGVYETEGP